MWAVLIGLVAVLVIGGGVARWWTAPQQGADVGGEVVLTSSPDPGETNTTGSPETSDAGVKVHVAGGVVSPGLVSLPAGARVADALAAAGGALPGVTLDSVNLARKVVDGEQVLVGGAPVAPGPANGASPAAASAGTTTAGAAAGLEQVNINSASSEELQALPRVGPATAAKIIEYRTANGPFTTVDQLLDVPGIGERTLANFRDLIRV